MAEQIAHANAVELQTRLLAWGHEHLRDLPWRRTRDPWAVLVSEIMLQQTQVARVIERHREFMQQFPDASSCAEATAGDVIRLWDGLGFNRRAVNLWHAAVVIRDEHGGAVPSELDALLTLPGIGPYTARAILAFAFERDVGVVDTNVGRLLARWTNRRLSSRQAQQLADCIVPTREGWRWNQTLFDFATAQCVKRDPNCSQCPLVKVCDWHGQGEDPAIRSAGVSNPQSRFEGSTRQIRGRLVHALRDGPIERSAIASFATEHHSPTVVQALADTLVADGLATWRDERLTLPDGPL